MANIYFTGQKEMHAKLVRLLYLFPQQVERAIHAEADIQMVEAQRRVPEDSGDLKATGRVQMESGRGEVKAFLTFGNEADRTGIYAIVQHERLDYAHTKGQAKYLESVLMEAAPGLGQRIANRIHLDMGDLF